MAPPSNEELKEKVKELKEARTADASKLQEMQQRIDELLALNEDLSTQMTANNTDDSQTTSTAAQNDGEDTMSMTVSSQPAEQTTQAGHDGQEQAFGRIPLPTLEKFDGGNVSVSEWWMTFVAYITLHHISEMTAIKMLPFYLIGIAKQWFIHLAEDSKGSLSKVRDAFYQRFRPTAPINKEVLKVQQCPGEKVDQYLFRVRTLAADSTLDDKLVTFFAVEGLLPSLRTIVVPQNPQTLEELRQQAALAESAVGTSSPPTVNVAEAVQEGIQAAVKSLEGVMIASMDNRFEHMHKHFQQQVHVAEQAPSTQGQPRSNYQDRRKPAERPQAGGPPGTRKPICFRCGECGNSSQCFAINSICDYCKRKGHIIKVCHKRLIENAIMRNGMSQ